MPYASNQDLPSPVQAHLPAHAQDIYREAFNRAAARYGDGDEGRLHRVAWAAVERAYEKVAGQWVPRERPRHP